MFSAEHEAFVILFGLCSESGCWWRTPRFRRVERLSMAARGLTVPPVGLSYRVKVLSAGLGAPVSAQRVFTVVSHPF